MKAARVLHRNALVYQKLWRGSVVFSFIQPLFFLTAVGFGIGALVSSQNPDAFEGVSLLEFVAPGLLAATCMQTGMFESTFPILSKVAWQRNYEAMLATPLTVSDLLFGELGWITVRLTMISTAFMLVVTALGIPSSPMAALAIPAAVLTGLAFAAPVIAYTATRTVAGDFNALFRFVMTPMFLFSGTFFSLQNVPGVIQRIAAATPLYHGVQLCRMLVLGKFDFSAAAGHAGFLAALLAAGTYLAYRSLTKRLVS